MLSPLIKGAVLLVAGAALLTVGCSSEGPKKIDAAGYARDMKQAISDYVNAARGNPKLARQEGAVLLEKLEVYESQPVGDHGPTYAKMLTKVRELAQRERSAAETDRLLGELQQLANQLPGEVRKSPSG